MPAAARPSSLKSAVYEQVARIGQAAASLNRLELLDLLAQGARTVESLCSQTSQSVATTSHYLQVLRRARLVEARRAGVYGTYRLADPDAGEFLLSLRRLAESRLAEVQHVTRQYLEKRGALEPVDNEELVRRVKAGEVTLIDVRPREEYAAAHIPGAISLPLAELGTRLGALRKHRDIVAYYRGPYCVMALDAVDLLRRKGFCAHRMEYGVPEWRAQGWRVATGDDRRAGGRP